MAVPLTSSAFADVLDVRFRDIWSGTYDKGQSQIPQYFGVETSDRDIERFSEVTPLGTVPQFTGTVEYLEAAQGYDVYSTHVEFAGGVQVKRALYDDDQFGVIDEVFNGLAEAVFKRHETDAAAAFANSFSSATSFFTHSEGVALCSNSHTSPVSGVSTSVGFDNLGTGALNKTNLAAARLAFRQFRDAQGDLIDETPDTLVVPPDLEQKAFELVRSSKDPDSANNTANWLEGKFSVKVWPRLTDSNDWWLTNMARQKRNLVWFWRIKPEYGKMESFDNIIAKNRVYMRYSLLRRDWRWCYGNQVS